MENISKFIGKYYEGLSIFGTVVIRFKINYVKGDVCSFIKYDDDSSLQPYNYFSVSECGHCWFRFYNNNYNRIVEL